MKFLPLCIMTALAFPCATTYAQSSVNAQSFTCDKKLIPSDEMDLCESLRINLYRHLITSSNFYDKVNKSKFNKIASECENKKCIADKYSLVYGELAKMQAAYTQENSKKIVLKNKTVTGELFVNAIDGFLLKEDGDILIHFPLHTGISDAIGKECKLGEQCKISANVDENNFVVNLISAKSINIATSFAITKENLTDLASCRTKKNSLDLLISSIISKSKKIVKNEGYWTQKISGEYFGMKISEVYFGVCDAKGSRECGAGLLYGIKINSPVKTSAKILKSNLGIDFTKEVRESPEAPTARALLIKDSSDTSSFFCDGGNL